jgi:hypothetical protein
MIAKLFVSPLKFQATHWLMVIAMAFVGAALNYVQAEPASQLLTALMTSAGLLALGKGALVAGLISALGVAMKQLEPTPPSSKFTRSEEPTVPEKKISSIPPRSDQRDILKKWLALPLVALFLFGCASLPAWEKAFTDVVADIQAGDGLAQIEQTVAVDLGFAGVVNTVVATFVVDAIDEAIALGLIPPALVPNAIAMEKTEAAKLIQMGGHLPTSVLLRHRQSEVALLEHWSVR